MKKMKRLETKSLKMLMERWLRAEENESKGTNHEVVDLKDGLSSFPAYLPPSLQEI